MLKGIKINLDLNNKQRTKLARHAGTARHAYNKGLEYCNDLFKQKINTPSAIDLHKWLVANIKKEFPWYYDVSKCPPQQALRNLKVAFENFHRIQSKSGYSLYHYKMIDGVKKPVGLKGLPNFKKKGDKDKFYLEGKIFIKDNKIKLPVIGYIKLSEDLKNKFDDVIIKNCVISRKADKWFVSFKYEVKPTFTEKKFNVVGVDLGISKLATLSDGIIYENLRPYLNAKNELRKLQKELSRRYKKKADNQSSNYKKTKLKISKLHARITYVRLDCLHKLTTYLAKNYETVVIEDLKVSEMTKNSILAAAILDGGFFEFKRQLLYKKQLYGGKLIIANTYFASSKLCSCCKNKNNDLKLSDRIYKCNNCENEMDRDINASMNLENLEKLINMADSLTVNTFGDESPTTNVVQLVDELGIRHQMHYFIA